MASLGHNELTHWDQDKNGHHFPGDIFKCIFLNENVWIWILLSLKFVSKGPINNIPALVQIMAWHLPGDNPLSEPMLVILLMHICVIRPQWVNWHWGNHIFYIKQGLTQTVAQVCLDTCQVHIINSLRPSDAIWRPLSGSTLAQAMACCLMAPNHYLNQCWLIISKA